MEGQAASAGIACGCNQGCLGKFSPQDISLHRLNMQDMENGEKEVMIMGALLSVQYSKEKSFRGKRKHMFFDYCFHGERFVLEHFVASMILGKKR